MTKEFPIPKICNERNFTSKYKYVSGSIQSGKTKYKANFFNFGNVKKKNNTKMFKTEREAAIAVDKHLIKIGREPVNILTRKI